ncbi:MAG: hypothetical protein GY696_32345 [Gammaproteobacteria bacterium]|nr:hypothetical protein [Gammaproteobacteria bacterium]
MKMFCLQPQPAQLQKPEHALGELGLLSLMELEDEPLQVPPVLRGDSGRELHHPLTQLMAERLATAEVVGDL